MQKLLAVYATRLYIQNAPVAYIYVSLFVKAAEFEI